MYIEMTTFAVPAFLVAGLKFLALVSLGWLAVGFVGVTIYQLWGTK